MREGQGKRPRVVVIGAGFGGLEVAKALRRAPVEVLVLDKRNHHLFQPLLYQVATAALAATDIAAPIRNVLRHVENCTVLLANVDRIDAAAKTVHSTDGDTLRYDYLVVAAGVTHRYFGHDEWQRFAPGLKSLEEALDIRRRILLAYENAEKAETDEERDDWLSFVVVGGGATGVELAGALSEIARRTMTKNFRRFDPRRARITLLEGGERLLSAFSPELSERVREDLAAVGVDVRTRTLARRIDAEGVELADGTRLRARTILWAAGVGGALLASTLGVPLDKMGRVPVERDLSVKGLGAKDVFVIGDLAAFEQDGAALPGVAQVALQQGHHVAQNIQSSAAGEPMKEFRYHDKGSMATIGRSRAVAEIGHVRLTGFVAWCAWLFVHVMALVGFRNRLAVLFEWAWAYVTYQRSARIILAEK